MLKHITSALTGALVALLVFVGMSYASPSSSQNLEGQTRLSGLSVGTDGLSVSGPLTTSNGLYASSTTYVSKFVQGGGVRATSTSGSVVPLLATDFDTENAIDVTLNVQDATLSMPASSTIKNIPSAGDTMSLLIRNASTTAGMDLTITGGTGVLLKKATSSAVIIGDTDGSNYARLDLTRKSDTDIEALLQIFID